MSAKIYSWQRSLVTTTTKVESDCTRETKWKRHVEQCDSDNLGEKRFDDFDDFLDPAGAVAKQTKWSIGNLVLVFLPNKFSSSHGFTQGAKSRKVQSLSYILLW